MRSKDILVHKDKNSWEEDLQFFLAGSYCPNCQHFDEERFLGNWHIPYFLVFSFIRRYTYRDYQVTGDLIESMVASEIWRYNVSRFIAKGLNPSSELLADEDKRRKLLPKCNTHSVAVSLGLPPQTVRRKVQALIDRGWVERSEKGELHITSRAEEEFNPAFNLETMRDFISTARHLFRHMGISPLTGTAKAPKKTSTLQAARARSDG